MTEVLANNTSHLEPLLQTVFGQDSTRPAGVSFSLIHLGETQAQIKNLLALMRPLAFAAPRTGHIGDWTAIARGRAGALDFNYSVIVGGYGVASIHALTMTESGEGGDQVYCPATVLDGGKVVRLPLLSWQGSGFQETSAERPLFTPLVLTKWRGSSIPLVELHRHRMADHPHIRFRYEVDHLLERERDLREGLVALLEAAADQKSQSLIDSVTRGGVCRQGHFSPDKIVWDGGCFRSGPNQLGRAGDVADAIIQLFRVVQEPDGFFKSMDRLPLFIPVISNLALTLFTGIFSALPTAGRELAVHLHWGARDMAGYPPQQRGYLSESGTRRRLTRMTDVLRDRCAWALPLKLALLPASIFMLAPLDDDHQDIALLERMVGQLKKFDPRCDPEIAIKVVTNLIEDSRNDISPYFSARFSSRSGLHDIAKTERRGLPVLPSFIADLSVQQGCVLVGALHKAIGAQA